MIVSDYYVQKQHLKNHFTEQLSVLFLCCVGYASILSNSKYITTNLRKHQILTATFGQSCKAVEIKCFGIEITCAENQILKYQLILIWLHGYIRNKLWTYHEICSLFNNRNGVCLSSHLLSFLVTCLKGLVFLHLYSYEKNSAPSSGVDPHHILRWVSEKLCVSCFLGQFSGSQPFVLETALRVVYVVEVWLFKKLILQ